VSKLERRVDGLEQRVGARGVRPIVFAPSDEERAELDRLAEEAGVEVVIFTVAGIDLESDV